MIELSRAAYDDIVYRAYGGGEAEICGVLAGTHGTDGGRASSSGDLRGGERRRNPQIRYLIDPEEQLETHRAGRGRRTRRSWVLPLAPDRADPPERDGRRAGDDGPGHSYVICALDGYPFVGSWRWRGDDDGFEQETVAVRSER